MRQTDEETAKEFKGVLDILNNAFGQLNARSEKSDERMKLALRLSDSCTLFGRCNRLTDPKSRLMASIVEILPPLVVS